MYKLEWAGESLTPEANFKRSFRSKFIAVTGPGDKELVLDPIDWHCLAFLKEANDPDPDLVFFWELMWALSSNGRFGLLTKTISVEGRNCGTTFAPMTPIGMARWCSDNLDRIPTELDCVLERMLENQSVTLEEQLSTPVPKITPPQTPPVEKAPPGYPDPKMEERDRWIYEKRKAGVSNPKLITQLAEIFVAHDWYHITTDEGIRKAVKRYIERTGAVDFRK